MVRPRLRLVSAHRLTTAFAVTLGLALWAPVLGCDKGDSLVETAFPEAGVGLRYDLQRGATFNGKVSRKEVVSSRGESMSRSISFTVQLTVLEVDAEGLAKVAATVGNIEINWNIPGLPISLKEFNDKAKQRLEGSTIRFNVAPNGKLSNIPPVPAELNEAEASVLDSVIDGLTSAFYEVPSTQLGAGETWDTSATRGREGKLGKYTAETVRGTLVGMFERPETQQQVAKLAIETDKTETTKTKDSSSEIRTRGEATVLFDTKASYMSAIDSKQTRSQGPTVTKVTFEATWTRTIAGSGGAAPPAVTPVVQHISDPCDNDYVGSEDCLDPCNSNYMGEQACAGSEPAAEPPEGGPAGEAETAEGAE